MEYEAVNNIIDTDINLIYSPDVKPEIYFSIDEKKSILGDIEKLSILEQKEVLKIIIDSKVKYSENQHGTFINFNSFNNDIILKIVEFIKFCEKNRKLFREREKEENEIEQNILIKKIDVAEKPIKQLKVYKKEIVRNIVLKKEKNKYSSLQEKILKIFKNSRKRSQLTYFKLNRKMKVEEIEEIEEIDEVEDIDEDEIDNEDDNGDYMINIDENSEDELAEAEIEKYDNEDELEEI